MVHGFDQWPDTTDRGLRERIREMKNAGLGGIVASVSVKNYMRDEDALELLRRGVSIAREEGMRVWIYDEEGYPSGAAGGLVLDQAPSVEAEGLIRVVSPAGDVRYKIIRLYEATHATENFYKKRPYINILDPHAVATFLAVTHDRYARVLTPISRYVEAFFTDEPSLINAYVPKGREYPPTLPWHRRLPGEFLARKGYDLLPHRESLFVDTGETDRKIRCDFYEVVADLFAETYFGALQQWCNRHGVASSGHLLGEETMVWQTDFNSEPFRCYRKFDIPGIDMITSDPVKIMSKEYFMVPKIAGSACRLRGQRRLMCEISDFFGVMDGRHASLEEMQCTAAILASFGVTDLCSYYTLTLAPESELKPGTFSPQQYRRYTEFTSRVASVFSQGTIETDVAVLYPITSLWAHFTPSHRSMYEPHPNPDVNFLDAAFTGCCRSLLQQHIDFDVVDEKSLAESGVEGRTLAVGERRYRVLVFPPLDTVRVRTLEMITAFAKAGGAVFAHSVFPRYAAEGPELDSRVATLVNNLRSAGALAGSTQGSPPLSYLLSSRVPPSCQFSPPAPEILCTTLIKGGGRMIFLVNASPEEYEGAVTMQGEGIPRVSDPDTGVERDLTGERGTGAVTRFSLRLRPFASAFVELR
jgi:hypothetical protein